MNTQHTKALNFWRGSQNYSNFTIERGNTLSSTQLNQPQTSQSSDMILQTDPPAASTANQVANSNQDVLGTPPTQENLETMPSTDVGTNNGGGQDLNLGAGSYGGGYGGGGFPSEEEDQIVAEEEIQLPENKILGLKPLHFWGGLISASVLGYLLFGRKGKTTKTIK
ncbi:MAG: hypothetical protein PHT69_02830 [Bacteroidales bacterium]|nr:hypothetical protein [Bacteroidales bacterium]